MSFLYRFFRQLNTCESNKQRFLEIMMWGIMSSFFFFWKLAFNVPTTNISRKYSLFGCRWFYRMKRTMRKIAKKMKQKLKKRKT